MPLLSVVIPMYNEKEVITETYKRLKSALLPLEGDYELIFVNDGSRDGTYDVLLSGAGDDDKVKIIDFARNFGHQMAVRAGLKMACGQAIAIIDADLQDPPELLPKMLEKWREGYDVVYGKRKSRQGESAFKKFTAFAFYRTLNALAGIDIPKDTGDFRIIDKKVKDAILSMREHGTFLRGMVSWVGYRQYPFEFERHERFAGTTKYPLKKMLKLAFDGIFSFSVTPIKFLSLIGIVEIIAAFVMLVLTLLLKFGSAGCIIMSVLLVGGALMLGMYILGEYIGRIYEETMDRPLYLISRTYGFEDKEQKER